MQKILGHHSILTTARYTHLSSTTDTLSTRAHRSADEPLRRALGDGDVIALSDVVARFGPECRERFTLHPAQLRAMAALERCRTRLASTFTAQCSNEACGTTRVVPHSCGHRLCPHCQHAESQRWIERQRQQLVPGPYFLVTFTLPAELRALAWGHQALVFDAMMDCAWLTLREFSLNHRQLRGTPGALAVLHTHSRELQFHPHVHLALPAAALDERRRLVRQLAPEQGYLFNHKALAKVFRGKLLAALKPAARVRQLRAQVLVFARSHFQKCHYNSANCSGAAGFSIPNA